MIVLVGRGHVAPPPQKEKKKKKTQKRKDRQLGKRVYFLYEDQFLSIQITDRSEVVYFLCLLQNFGRLGCLIQLNWSIYRPH